MKDRAEFFTWHSPSHDPVGCNGIVSEIDVISEDVHLGAPKDRATLFEHFHNTKHFFVDGGVFQLCSGWLS